MGNKVDCHIRIKEAMELRNLNQTDIVERTNIKKSALSQYISGKITPRQNAIDELSKVLNVSEPWLMGYDVPMKRTVLKKENQKTKTDEIVLTPEQEAELQYIIEHNMLFFKRNKMDEDDAKKLADILREFYIETLEQK
jgi:transcriptional repressor